MIRSARGSQRSWWWFIIAACSLSETGSCIAADETAKSTDLKTLSIEDLMDVKITSASRKEQKLADAAAAVYVISQEDIRRSPATTIPELLRNVPGVQVARLDANKWAISSRGFNDRFANKLLVMIDGRTVYTPLFSGVYWDVQDVMLQDIDRIEVIRGPGASLWGANAVNGIVNIITKSAEQTQGGLLTAGAGTEEQGFGSARYGGQIGTRTYYRAYLKYFNRDNFEEASGREGADSWDALRGGFRVDSEVSERDNFTVQGDLYDGRSGQRLQSGSFTPPYSTTFDDDADVSGGNVLGRWTHRQSDRSEMSLQTYYDRTERRSAVLGECRDIFDVDFQHKWLAAERHELLWGLGYRYTGDDIDNEPITSLDPDSREDDLYNGFVQDDITLVQDLLRLSIGTKVEHNDYTGYEVQPSARALYTPDERNSLWAAVSRAVRTPSRAESDARINGPVLPPGAQVALFGDEDFGPEDLVAYELGYRVQCSERLSLDLATFYNEYDNLQTLEAAAPFLEGTPAPPHLVVPLRADNKMSGDTYGAELAATWGACDWWHFKAGYSYLQMDLHLDRDSSDTTSESAEGKSPEHQFFVRSLMDLPRNFEFDAGLQYVDDLPALDIGHYYAVDARIGWKATKDVEISIVGQSLLDDQHPEFAPSIISVVPTEVERSIYGMITWRI